MDFNQFEKEYIDYSNYDLVNDVLKTPIFISSLPVEVNYKGIKKDEYVSLYYLDIYARFLRLNNYNVLFKLLINNTNNNIYNKDRKQVFEDNKKQIIEKGISVSNNNILDLNSDEYLGFVQKFLQKLFEIKMLKKVSKNVVYLDDKIYQDGSYEKIDDQYYDGYQKLKSSKKESYVIDLSLIKEDILKSLYNLKIEDKKELYKKFGYMSAINLKFYDQDMNILELKIDNPEYLYGLSFIIINPDKYDVRKLNISYEEEVLKQIDVEYSGIEISNPLTNYNIPIYLSYKSGEAIHFGIPSLNISDEQFIDKNNLPYLPIFDYVNDKRILVNSGFLNGYTETEAHEKIIEVLETMSLGDKVDEIALNYLTVSSITTNEYAMPFYKNGANASIPLRYNLDNEKYYCGKTVIENNVVNSFIDKEIYTGLAIFIERFLNIDKIDFEDSYTREDLKKFNEIDNLVVCKNKTDYLYYFIIYNCLFKYIFGPIYDLDIDKIHVIETSYNAYLETIYKEFDLKFSILKEEDNISDFEEERDYIINAFKLINDHDELEEEFNNLVETLNFDMKVFNYSKYYLDLLAFIDIIYQSEGIEIKKARKLLLYLYIILPSLANYIAKHILELKYDLADYGL